MSKKILLTAMIVPSLFIASSFLYKGEFSEQSIKTKDNNVSTSQAITYQSVKPLLENIYKIKRIEYKVQEVENENINDVPLLNQPDTVEYIEIPKEVVAYFKQFDKNIENIFILTSLYDTDSSIVVEIKDDTKPSNQEIVVSLLKELYRISDDLSLNQHYVFSNIIYNDLENSYSLDFKEKNINVSLKVSFEMYLSRPKNYIAPVFTKEDFYYDPNTRLMSFTIKSDAFYQLNEQGQKYFVQSLVKSLLNANKEDFDSLTLTINSDIKNNPSLLIKHIGNTIYYDTYENYAIK